MPSALEGRRLPDDSDHTAELIAVARAADAYFAADDLDPLWGRKQRDFEKAIASLLEDAPEGEA